MCRWWNNEKVGVKVALIGLVGTICACCGGIIAFNLWGLIKFPADLKRNSLPPLEIISFVASEPGRLYAYSDEVINFLITPNCWEAKNSVDRVTIEGMEYPTVSMNFVVIARKEQILIDEITLVLENYSSPLTMAELSDYTIKLGQYGGGYVQFIDLGNIDIFPDNKEFHPSNNKSFQVPELDSLGFEYTASFHQPGEYSLRIEVVAKDYWKREQIISSDVLEFNWIKTPDIQNISFLDPISSNEVQLEMCQ